MSSPQDRHRGAAPAESRPRGVGADADAEAGVAGTKAAMDAGSDGAGAGARAGAGAGTTDAEADAGPDPTGAGAEADAVRRRYARRRPDDPRYSLLDPAALAAWQERQRAIARLFARLGWHDLGARRLLEVGCGTGGNLLDALRLGFAPWHLTGIELLPQRLATARERLPARLALLEGDALEMDLPAGRQDVVLQATVFSSLLDDAVQQRLADAMWRWTRPGGGVLWYDFTVDNPRNADVRGVPLRRVRALFPRARIEARRLTLAPPIARAVGRWPPSFHTVLNALPLLRTHVLCWMAKREDER